MINNTFKKKDLVKILSNQTGFSQNFTKKIIDSLIKIYIERIKKGYLNFKNLGTFKIIFKNERIGRNPKTKKEFIISARKTVSFTPSKKILKILDKSL